MSSETSAENSGRKHLPTMLVDDTDKQPYLTTDINVVAYLTMKGFSVNSIAREEGSNRAVFCFMLPTPEEKKNLKQHVRDYHNNVGNFRLYSDCWRNAKGFVHNLK